MKPYYEQDGITIFHGDCRSLLPLVLAPDLLCSDPPYGIGHLNKHGNRSTEYKPGRRRRTTPYTPIAGDFEPFDPAHLLRFPRLILWGANWYSSRLPDSGGWLIWDKKDGGTPDDFSDAEMAWTNIRKTARVFSHKWRGMIRASEQGVPRVHPTQKPIALMEWCLKLAEAKDVLDPYMGSGSTLVAAQRLGIPAIGMDVEERYCEIAANRLSQGILQFA